MQVGQKVMCIDDSIKPELSEKISRDYLYWVEKDTKYTIREILNNDGIVTGILVEEIYNLLVPISLIGKMQEPAFASWRFAPLQEFRKTIEEESIEKQLKKSKQGIEILEEKVKAL